MDTTNTTQPETKPAQPAHSHAHDHGDGHVHGPGCSHHHHPQVLPFVRTTPKLGRNDVCSCGSGKKFKKCCGK